LWSYNIPLSSINIIISGCEKRKQRNQTKEAKKTEILRLSKQFQVYRFFQAAEEEGRILNLLTEVLSIQPASTGVTVTISWPLRGRVGDRGGKALERRDHSFLTSHHHHQSHQSLESNARTDRSLPSSSSSGCSRVGVKRQAELGHHHSDLRQVKIRKKSVRDRDSRTTDEIRTDLIYWTSSTTTNKNSGSQKLIN
jgi:hypothetical protein